MTKDQENFLKKSGVRITVLQTIIGTIESVSMSKKMAEKLFGQRAVRK